MKAMFYACVAMTVLLSVGTVWFAAFGDDLLVVLFGAIGATFGVIVLSVWNDLGRREEMEAE